MVEKQQKRKRTEYKLKKLYDREKMKSLVNIGEAFQRCRNLRDFKGIKTDEDFCRFGQVSNNVSSAVSLFTVFNRSV